MDSDKLSELRGAIAWEASFAYPEPTAANTAVMAEAMLLIVEEFMALRILLSKPQGIIMEFHDD